MKGEKRLPAVVLCLEYSLAVRGGVSVLVEELVEGLAGDFRFWVMSPDRPEELKEHRVYRHLAGHFPFQQSCHPPKPAFAQEARRIAGEVKAAGIELAHFHAGGTFGWGNRWPGSSLPHFFQEVGIPSLWTNHLTEAPAAGYAWKGRREWLSRLLVPLARAGKSSQMEVVATELAVSEHDRAFLAREFPRGAGKLRRLYHSRLETGTPPPPAVREKLVLAVGHLAFRKGQHLLVRAFLEVAAEFPEWKLLILGHDSGDGCKQEIDRLCEGNAAAKRVELPGAHPKPMEVMTRAAIFVQPSLEEALGLAAQEAIFVGCPAIGTDAGGIPEVIDDGKTGLIVPHGDASALAGALRRMMSDEALRESMSSRGREAILAKGMSREGMIDAHRRLYPEVLGKS